MNGGLQIKTVVHVKSVERKKNIAPMAVLANDLGAGMQFKGNSQALKGQFESGDFNCLLYATIKFLDAWVWKLYGKRWVVTCVNRTPEAQVDSCKKYGYKSRFEHCASEAIDLRSRNFTEKEIEQVLRFARSYLSGFCRLEYHVQGTGKHFHLTTAGYRRREDKICKIVKETEGASVCYAG